MAAGQERFTGGNDPDVVRALEEDFDREFASKAPAPELSSDDLDEIQLTPKQISSISTHNLAVVFGTVNALGLSRPDVSFPQLLGAFRVLNEFSIQTALTGQTSLEESEQTGQRVARILRGEEPIRWEETVWTEASELTNGTCTLPKTHGRKDEGQ